MKFIIFSKASIQVYPLIISLAYAAKELNFEVEIVTQNINLKLKNELSFNGINVFSIINKEYKLKVLKYIHWYRFAKFAKKKILFAEEPSVLWVTGADTAICMGKKTLKKRKFYFQINELYDKLPFYLKHLEKITKLAYKNIVPEKNRAAIFQVWFGLKTQPFVLPNKPFFDDGLILKGENIYKKHIDFLKKEKENNKTIFLYQGHLGNDRNFSKLLEIISKKNNILVVLMGMDHELLDKYQKICPFIYHIPHIPAPFHLSITKYADIGILVYLPISLNNIYCAPNKIWEYTKYGLALISNNIIGLEDITNMNLGVQFDINDTDEINNQMEVLLSNIKYYQKNSTLFYENLNYKEKLKHILL
jgi:hypothetical protein